MTGTNFCIPMVILALSAVLRLPALFSNLWLDEIWSLSATTKLTSAVEVFTKYRSDNNHPLNSLFLYTLGDQQYWEVYRIPSFLSGVAIVLLAWSIARREGYLDAVLAAALTAFSYLLIHYSSEARGYSLVVMFSFAGFYALQRLADRHTWPWALAYWCFSVLGTLSHLTYLFFFLAGLIWFPLHQRGRKANQMPIVCPFLMAFCVPGAFLLFFLLTFARRTVMAPVPYYNSGLDVLLETLSFAGGGPPSGPGAFAVSAIVFTILLAAIVWHRWRDPALGVFYFVVIIYPVLLVTVRQRSMLEPRYFLVSIAFGMLAVSGLLANLFRRGPAAKVIVASMLALYVVGNGLHTAKLIRYGRGEYKLAVEYMEEHTPEAVITVTSNHFSPNPVAEVHRSGPVLIVGEDHYFSNRLLLDYYRRYLSTGKSLAYYSGNECPLSGTKWFVLDSFERTAAVPNEFQDSHGKTYRLEKKYPHSAMSGVTWHLYRRLPPL